MSFARRSKKWVFSLPNNNGVVQSRSRKKKRGYARARPILYAQSYAIKSPVLMISVSSKVSSMLWCKSSRPILVTARVCVCLNPRTKCFLSPPNFVRALLLYLQNPRETFGEKVAFFTSSRGPKSNDIRARRRRRRRRKAAAVFVSVLSTRGGKGPSSPDDAGQEGGRSSKRRRSQFVWGKTSPFF